jgi:hypothetical protein
VTPVVRHPADTRGIPQLIIRLKRDHSRMTRVFALVRRANDAEQTTLAMQGLLLEVARSVEGLREVALAYDLPLDELVRSKINATEAEFSAMERFIPAIIEGDIA